MEREIRPLVKGWKMVEREYGERRFKFYENNGVVVVCGGIGPEAARRATEAVLSIYKARAVQSVGFAGALDDRGKVGDVAAPGRVVDATDGSSFAIDHGVGTLVSFGSVAGPDQKARLAKAYAAQMVDMEAAAVARGAEARGATFHALKVVSDEAGFAMPVLDRFVSNDGQFRNARFALFALARPWLWPAVLKLARNSAKASRALCRALEGQLAGGDILKSMNSRLHPIGTTK
jgi:adenosylhomocysteine nucleosidase